MTAKEMILTLRVAWLKSGMTMDELAKKSGVSASTIENWFTSSTCPRIAAYIKVADALGMRVEVKK